MDVLAIGDTTEDIFLQMHDASLQCNVDGKKCMICFDFGEKIAVEGKIVISGVGNAANHAIGIARLGHSSGIYTVVGDDTEGHEAKKILEKNGVDVSNVVFDTEHGTNLSVVINFKSERTILVYHEPRTYELPSNVSPKWLYLTSASGDGVKNLHDQVLQLLEKNKETKLAFNPGTHQINLGKEELLPLLKKTELLFLNREEAARVLEIETTDVHTLIYGFHAIGVPTVVLTDGPKGAYASNGKNIYYLPIYPGKEVERTGAGDAYGSGFLAGILHGKGISEAMQWGNANATSVVMYVGAREGLLEQEALLHMIQEFSTIKPTHYVN
ncbi:MAG TPA: carbohydrate kinase family protein [Candidatus Andersenbacteria bacterium]|nr:carbohydrate kinase family protein [Candidatus Andersenbacteria bacterium]